MEKTLNEEIGKIQKPKADKVIGKKKAFICVLLQAPQEASKELHDLIFKYWEAVDKNISTLEEKTGIVKKIFVEGIPGKGEDVAMNLKEASLGAWNVIEERRKTGAEISELENLENLQKVIDWSKCLNVGLTNRSVAEKISEELKKASEERFKFIEKSLNDNLLEGESAIIFTGNQDINIKRSEEAINTTSKIVAVSCPFCNTMMNDGVTVKQKEIDVVDIAQMIEKAEDL